MENFLHGKNTLHKSTKTEELQGTLEMYYSNDGIIKMVILAQEALTTNYALISYFQSATILMYLIYGTFLKPFYGLYHTICLIVPILQMRKLKLREGKQLAKTQSRVSIQPPWADSKALLLPPSSFAQKRHEWLKPQLGELCRLYWGVEVSYTTGCLFQKGQNEINLVSMPRVDARGKRLEATVTSQGRGKVDQASEEGMEPVDTKLHYSFGCF